MVDSKGDCKTYPEPQDKNVTILPIKFVSGDNNKIAYFAQSQKTQDNVSYSLMAIPLF
jgi:hypothetical protein